MQAVNGPAQNWNSQKKRYAIKKSCGCASYNYYSFIDDANAAWYSHYLGRLYYSTCTMALNQVCPLRNLSHPTVLFSKAIKQQALDIYNMRMAPKLFIRLEAFSGQTDSYTTIVCLVGCVISYLIVRKAHMHGLKSQYNAYKLQVAEILTDAAGGLLSVIASLHYDELWLGGCSWKPDTRSIFFTFAVAPTFIMNQVVLHLLVVHEFKSICVLSMGFLQPLKKLTKLTTQIYGAFLLLKLSGLVPVAPKFTITVQL